MCSLLAAVPTRGALLLMTIRRIALQLAAPVISAGSFVFSLMVPIILVLLLAVYWITTPNVGNDPYVPRITPTEWAVNIGFVIGLWLGTKFILDRLVGPVFTVLAEILHYIGSPRWRDAIQSQLSELIEQSGPLASARIFLVGHSLGSVICAHHLLCFSARYSAAHSVCLITMGSPLHRFFHRFFPYFTPHLAHAAATLHACLPGFRWLNVYRPFDPIGTALAPGAPGIENINTHQRSRWLALPPTRTTGQTNGSSKRFRTV